MAPIGAKLMSMVAGFHLGQPNKGVHDLIRFLHPILNICSSQS
jgi:hypothetical protein